MYKTKNRQMKHLWQKSKELDLPEPEKNEIRFTRIRKVQLKK